METTYRRQLRMVSNQLSLARILLAVPTVLAMIAGQKEIAVTLFFVSAATDYLDGFIARRRNEVSELGKIVDPLADKIYVAAAVVTMLLLGFVPLWLVLVVLARDIAILLGGLYIEQKTGRLLTSNWTGKWTVGLLSLTLLLSYLEIDPTILTILSVLTTIMLAYSTILYLRTALATLRES